MRMKEHFLVFYFFLFLNSTLWSSEYPALNIFDTRRTCRSGDHSYGACLLGEHRKLSTIEEESSDIEEDTKYESIVFCYSDSDSDKESEAEIIYNKKRCCCIAFILRICGAQESSLVTR